MEITIFSVVPKRLVQEAERIEKHAEDQLEAWLVLGQSEKYAKALDEARILRSAANEKDVYSRREILKKAGFIVKNLNEKTKKNPIDDLPIWARQRPGRLGATQPLTAAQKRKAKARAAAAGRKYPNLVDNIAAARNPTMKKSASWVIVNKETGEPVLETYNEKMLSKLNTEKYEAIPALKYLVALNKKIKENPTMKPASPAQLAARKRFAEMARSGAFKKAAKRKANPTESGMRYQIFKSNGPLDSEYKTLAQMQSALDEIDRKPSGRYYGYDKAFGRTYHSFAHNTPSAVVKNNPMQKYTVLHRGTANVAGQVTASGPQAAKQKIAEKLGIPTLAYLVAKKTNPAKKTVSQKISQLVHEGYPQRQAVAVALSEQRAGKVKRNPSGLYAMKTQYLVSCPATKKNMGFFDKQSDAKIYAQELADKHGMQYAISTVKVPKIQAVHFVVGESTKSFKV